jgi:hypothetical protein
MEAIEMDWLDYRMHDAALDHAHEVTRRRLERQACAGQMKAEGRRSSFLAKAALRLAAWLGALAATLQQRVGQAEPPQTPHVSERA